MERLQLTDAQKQSAIKVHRIGMRFVSNAFQEAEKRKEAALEYVLAARKAMEKEHLPIVGTLFQSRSK